MYGGKFNSPEEVRAFLDSDGFADGFKKWLVTSGILKEMSRQIEPLLRAWCHFLKSHASQIANVIVEFQKWNLSCEVIGRAGWLPHYTTPFDNIAEYGDDAELIRNKLDDYYTSNWQNVRAKIEARISHYRVDREAKATLREALDAHEAGLYRCVCRVLFPEIERVFRKELFGNRIGPIGYRKFIKRLTDDDKSIDAFIHRGLYDLTIFAHLTKAVREKKRIERGEEPVSESDDLIFGLFTDVKCEEHLESLKNNPVPNRHAAIHGLVVYSSQQNSLNTIFLADYIFEVIKPSKLRPTVSECGS